jgi:hypothetical protein
MMAVMPRPISGSGDGQAERNDDGAGDHREADLGIRAPEWPHRAILAAPQVRACLPNQALGYPFLARESTGTRIGRDFMPVKEYLLPATTRVPLPISDRVEIRGVDEIDIWSGPVHDGTRT